MTDQHGTPSSSSAFQRLPRTGRVDFGAPPASEQGLTVGATRDAVAAGQKERLPIVLGIAGSLRRRSWNRALLRAAGETAPGRFELRIWDGLSAVPPYDEDEDGALVSEGVAGLRRAISEADAVLFATPEYNRSIPGVLKNAIDWASRPYGESSLSGKPVAVIGASPGRGGAAQALEDMRKVLGAAGALVAGVTLGVSAVHRRFDDEGRLLDEGIREALVSLTRGLVASAPTAAEGGERG